MTSLETSTLTTDASPFRHRIDEALAGYTQFGPGCPPRLAEAIRYSLLAPGKRLRPMLVLMAAEACGGDVESALPAACAVEMVHTYSLIHDDLPAMDNDDLRRGRPTCHKVFGEALAILAGDALLALALEIVAKRIRPQSTAAACCAVLAEAAGPCCLVGGQVDDLSGVSAENDGLSAEGGTAALEAIHHRKTGALIRASLRLGALAAGAREELSGALEQYGRALGLAFQITDDLLDVRGHAHDLGKRVGKDAEQGKLTFPGLLGIDQSVHQAEELIRAACQSLVPLGNRAEGLGALARYVLERKR
jgi:geranylgeranyl diphosphate synthase type II